FLVFANYRYAPDYLRGLVPLLNRLIHVIRMRIETLLLLHQLSRTNIHLEEMVKERTEKLQETMDRLRAELDERRRAEERARESEAHFRMIFEQARDGIALIDPETGCVMESNPVFRNLTGRSEEELRKTPVWELRPPEMVEEARKKFYEIRERGEGGSAELHFQRPDGGVVPVEFVTRRVDFGGRKYHLSIVRDLSERMTFIERLERKRREMEILYKLVSSAQKGHDLHSALQSLEEALLELLKPSLIMFYRKSGDELKLIRRYPEGEEAIKERKRLGECLCGSAAKSMGVILSGDILKDPRCTLDECKDAGMRAFAAIPLGEEGDLAGLLGLAWDEVRDFSEEGEFYHALGAGLTLVFRNIALIDELKRHSRNLEDLVRERTDDLQRVVNLMAGRELRIKELKDVVDRLREQILSL
ncbi:MAG: PAS domain S-box protein, partial [Nitrospirae bacterium]